MIGLLFCCQGANGFIIAYDVTSKESFTKAEHQLKELDMCGGEEAPKILLGNKVFISTVYCLRYLLWVQMANY